MLLKKTSLVSTLRKMAQPAPQETEQCDFCGNTLDTEHRHLVDVATMQFMCVCEVCAVIKADDGTYKTLPNRYLRLVDFKMPDDLWMDFLIPVNMAFFVFSSVRGGTVAYYPAPTGATESKLKMEAWQKLEELNPVLQSMNPDVEGLLLNRLDPEGQYYIVPIDSCYKLNGMIRTSWKGLFGGKEVNDTIRNFFNGLKQRANAGFKV